MLLAVLVLVMLVLGLKIGTFLRLSSVKKEYQLGENHIEIKKNYVYPGQFFQYSLPYLQTMPFLLMYYTMSHFQSNHKKILFVFFDQLN